MPHIVRDLEDAQTEPSDDVVTPSGEQIDRWIRAYLAHAPLSLTLREINRLIAIEAVANSGGAVLDVGCGTGGNWLACEPAFQVFRQGRRRGWRAGRSWTARMNSQYVEKICQ